MEQTTNQEASGTDYRLSEASGMDDRAKSACITMKLASLIHVSSYLFLIRSPKSRSGGRELAV